MSDQNAYPVLADLEDPREIELARRVGEMQNLNDAEKWVLFKLARWRHIFARPEQLMPMDAQYAFFVGGRGCVAAGTLIEDPDGGPPTKVEDWQGGPVISRWEDGTWGRTIAGPSFLKGRAPLYRVRTDTGREIVTTDQHRFLTPSGWVHLADIELGSLLACQQDLYFAGRWERIVAIDPEGEGDFYDLSVPGPECYVANGFLNHNSGKTRAGAQTLFEWAWELPYTEWACVGPTRLAVRNLMFLGPSGLRNVIPEEALLTGDWDNSFNETRLELRLANGSMITGFSSERPGRIRGANLSGFWGDEPAEWKDSNQLPLEINTTFSNLMLAVRAETEGGTRGIITGTPTPCPLMAGSTQHDIPGLMTGMTEPPISLVRMSTRDNLENLDAGFARLVMSLDGTRLGRQEIDAELLSDVEGAPWKMHWITVDNSGLTLTFDRIVIGIDPSGGDGSGEGDEVGVVAIGVVDSNYWVLEDLSGDWSPSEWSDLVWDCYKRWEPQCYRKPHLKVEGNYGKELAAHPLKVSEERVPGIDIDVRSVKGTKHQRAKASAQLYEPSLQRAAGTRVRHCGRFHVLVNEMTTFLPESSWSPNRMDALTLAMNWLSEFDELPIPTGGKRNTSIAGLLGKHSGGYR